MRLDDLYECPVKFLKNVGAGVKAGVAGYQAAKVANTGRPGQGMFNQRKEFYAQQRAQQAAVKPAQTAQAQPQSQTQYGAMKPTTVSAKMGAAPGQEPPKPAGGKATATWGGGGQLAYSTTVGGKPTATAAPASTTAAPAGAAPASVPAAGSKDTTATATAAGTTSTKPRMNIGRAATGEPKEKPVAAPGAADFETLKKTVSGLTKREQQKILTQLLSSLGTPVTR
jgi:hypothetical protein